MRLALARAAASRYPGRVAKQHTIFGDFRFGASLVVRVHTQSSVYLIGFHEARGRKYVVVRGMPGTDRESVIVRDSDPRIGGKSLFDVPHAKWVGKELEIATIITSPVVSAEEETDPVAIASVSGAGHPAAPSQGEHVAPPAPAAPYPPVPGGLSTSPRIVPGLSRGTSFNVLSARPAADKPADKPAAEEQPKPAVAKVVAPPPIAQYVRFAEDAAALLRALAGREDLFQEAHRDYDRLRPLRKALDECATHLEALRRRDRS